MKGSVKPILEAINRLLQLPCYSRVIDSLQAKGQAGGRPRKAHEWEGWV